MIRGINVYGDPSRWAPQPTALFTVLSFLNTTKYPPSLLFLLMTLGPAMLFLRAMDRGTPTVLRPALVYGRVPLFYYVLHFPLIHLLAVIDLPGALWHGALDVRVARPWQLSVHDATRVGVFAAGDLPGMGVRGSGDVCAVPLVRRTQAAPQ